MAIDVSTLLCANMSLVGDKPAWDASVQYALYSSCSGAAYTLVPMAKWREIETFLKTGPTTPTPTPEPQTGQFTAAEVQALKIQAASPSPFNLSYSEGGAIAAAVVAVWALAWGIRSSVKTINLDSSE
jgi:hypothetical protein